MKKKPSSLFFRVLVALVLAVAAPAAAGAQPYIDDVLLIGGDASDVLTRVMKYQKNGWKAIGKDLNSGAGGDYIHLLYKPASSNDGFNYGSITGFYIHSKSTNSLPDKTKTIGGRTYYLVPCEGGSDFVNGRGDLNEGCGTDSDYIYLYYTRDPFPDNRVVTGITFNATQSGALGTNGGSLGYDLNNGAGGDYIYMHVTTATELEPLRIGDGSSGTNNIPFYLGNDYYPYSVSQQIYTAEDIGMAGSVKAISFYHRMDDMSLSMNGVQIYMKHTDKNAFSGAELDPMDDFVKVFEGKISISGAGWMTIRLDEPFTYDGNSNLMICCYDPVGVHPKGNTFTYHFADNKMRRLASHDPINLQETLVGPVNTTMRNDIQLNIVPNAYPNPVKLTVNGFTDKSASVSWSAPEGATGYAYTYRRVDGGDWAADNTVKSTSVTLENLTANTTYDFRVRALFGHYSSNAVNYRFMTEGPMEALPHDQGFENGMGGWRLENGNGRTGITTREHHEGAYSFEFDEGSPHAQFLRSPLLEGNAPKVVSFYFKNFSEEAGESVSVGYRSAFQVGWSTKSNRLEDFVVTPEEEAFNGRWTRYTLQLPEDTRYVLIMVKDHEAWLYVDDISIAEVPKPVATLATVMGERKYVTTFYDPAKKWQLPEGALAYTVHQEGEDYVFYCIDDVVRAGTPVVIMMDKLAGDTEDTKEIDLSVTGASGRAPHLYNILRGAEAPVAVSGGKVDGKTVYVLGIVEGKLGFYQFSGSVIPAGKAYYLAE